MSSEIWGNTAEGDDDFSELGESDGFSFSSNSSYSSSSSSSSMASSGEEVWA